MAKKKRPVNLQDASLKWTYCETKIGGGASMAWLRITLRSLALYLFGPEGLFLELHAVKAKAQTSNPNKVFMVVSFKKM
ncbi:MULTISPECIES: hypothetical protein [Vitreoscilla]|uniref:Uncharacterized protein n=1 Tax=Vitreoscilla stercoraria TaxID=61 RepID=A0ABY4E893_VITST|nr:MULTISPECIES: hypothetical protein [Vitreoscilla]AUZ04686.1 hypothetical protein ADP71_09750 [Vitreoscilla sp. C1]UOO91625.1 hypothetical protein LVJ81_08195 [Vitreoscilla stercoraria]